MKASIRAGTVRRILLTSSLTTIMGLYRKGKEVSEKDWATDPSVLKDSYAWSRIVSEKAARDYGKNGKIEIVCLYPSAVVGPPINGTPNPCISLMSQLLLSESPIVPPFALAVV